MMNLIQKFLSKDRSNKSHIRKNFTAYFFSIPEHQWILETCNKAHFDKLFSHLPSAVLEAMMTKYPVVFVPSYKMNGSRNPGAVLSNTIIVFPEFQRLLKSEKKSAVAYLAHELAFILLELEGLREDPLIAEIEADKFVCDLGLTFELEELLLMLDETIEKRLRLTYVTINHFKENN
jgi:hypothetical protein